MDKEGTGETGIFFRGFQSKLYFFATHESCPAEELFKALRERHICVRYFPGSRTGNHLRITVGTREEMETFLDFLGEYLNK